MFKRAIGFDFLMDFAAFQIEQDKKTEDIISAHAQLIWAGISNEGIGFVSPLFHRVDVTSRSELLWENNRRKKLPFFCCHGNAISLGFGEYTS